MTSSAAAKSQLIIIPSEWFWGELKVDQVEPGEKKQRTICATLFRNSDHEDNEKNQFRLTKSSVFVSTILCFNWKLRQQQNSHDTVPFIVTSYNYSQQIKRCSTKSWDSHRGGLISVNATLLFDCFLHCADDWVRLWIERQLIFRCCPRFDGKLCTLFIVKSEKSAFFSRDDEQCASKFYASFLSEFSFDEQMMDLSWPSLSHKFLIATINHTQITKPKLKGKEVAYWLLRIQASSLAVCRPNFDTFPIIKLAL